MLLSLDRWKKLSTLSKLLSQFMELLPRLLNNGAIIRRGRMLVIGLERAFSWSTRSYTSMTKKISIARELGISSVKEAS